LEQHIVKVIAAEYITHDVKKIAVTKPDGYVFIPGQATEVAINKPDWQHEKRPFTFTSLNEWDHLEFVIKCYKERRGVTNEIAALKEGDELLIHDVWGAIHYQGEGTFIAGGAGITPFISIFRDLKSKNSLGGNALIFANKTQRDIILEDELQEMLGNRFINILSDEETRIYPHGRIDETFLKSHIGNFDRQFYVCGPPPMMDAILAQLKNLGVGMNAVTIEI
jgi:ferredoxin-NADP reductase